MPTKYDENAKLWTNPDENQLRELNLSINKWIWEKLSAHGSKVAQINDDTGTQMTFNELRLKAIRAAQNLQKNGFQSYQKFCFMTINNENLLPIVLASFGLACPIVPLFPILSTNEIVRILTKTKPSIVFCDANLYSQLNAALNELQQFKTKIFLLDNVYADGIETVECLFRATGEENFFTPVEYNLETDVAGIFSSSGTTGPSKSVCISYGSHAFVPNEIDADWLADNCVLFTCDAIYWSVGFKAIFNSIYHGAIRIISSKPFSTELQLKIIEKYKVTVLFNTPFIMAACLKSDYIHKLNLSSVKRIIFYGSKLPNTLVTDIKRHFPNSDLLILYGLTEAGIVSTNLVNAHDQISESTNVNGGQLYYGCTIKIVDDDGKRCGPNENAEICVKNQYQFINYFDDAAASAAAIDADGFFRTGDIGHFDSDSGNLFVVDRKKFVATVFYFENILVPSAIEECLIKLPGVVEVCVVRIPLACDECLPAAAVIRNSNSNLNQHDVFEAIAENFPTGLHLRAGIYFVDSLPKTHSGKFIRKEITEMLKKMFIAAKENDPLIH